MVVHVLKIIIYLTQLPSPYKCGSSVLFTGFDGGAILKHAPKVIHAACFVSQCWIKRCKVVNKPECAHCDKNRDTRNEIEDHEDQFQDRVFILDSPIVTRSHF
jgi:hypothetical protein